jgi:GNAT superfamily N-acetyltransferase
MSDRLKIGRILPTRQNAEAIVAMTREDLLRAEVPDKVVDLIASESEAEVRAQQKRLARHRERYLGAVAGRQLPLGLGAPLQEVAKLNEWNAADQAQYETEEAAAKLREQVERGEKELTGHPLGIFALLVASDVLREGRHLEVADQLLEAVARRAGDREIRVGLHDSDPLLPAFEDHGFQPTDAIGTPISKAPDYRVRLYVKG